MQNENKTCQNCKQDFTIESDDFSFYEKIKVPAGTDIDLVELLTDTDGKVYARSKWARDNSKNWGVLANKMMEIPAEVPAPPEPLPPKPIDVDPSTPGQGDVETRLSALERAVKAILDFLSSIFSGFKFNK